MFSDDVPWLRLMSVRHNCERVYNTPVHSLEGEPAGECWCVRVVQCSLLALEHSELSFGEVAVHASSRCKRSFAQPVHPSRAHNDLDRNLVVRQLSKVLRAEVVCWKLFWLAGTGRPAWTNQPIPAGTGQPAGRWAIKKMTGGPLARTSVLEFLP